MKDGDRRLTKFEKLLAERKANKEAYEHRKNVVVDIRPDAAPVDHRTIREVK